MSVQAVRLTLAPVKALDSGKVVSAEEAASLIRDGNTVATIKKALVSPIRGLDGPPLCPARHDDLRPVDHDVDDRDRQERPEPGQSEGDRDGHQAQGDLQAVRGQPQPAQPPAGEARQFGRPDSRRESSTDH